jgi:hypothetical protein
VFSDTVSANAAYVYRVRAIDTSSYPSPFSIPDAATTLFFTTDPLVAGSTVVQAQHITEIRSAINLLREVAGIGDFSFTDPAPTGVAIQALHLQQMRTALTDARNALGLPVAAFTDPTITAASTVIKATHFQQLRDAVK